jgi:hypothetical protein
MKKLREYKGVTYRDDVWWYEGVGYDLPPEMTL